MATLARIDIFPFKSLDPENLQQATLLPSGALAGDRRFAIADVRGDLMTAKRTPAIHRLRSRFDSASGQLTLRVEGSEEEHAFNVETSRDTLAAWLSDYFDTRVTIVENADGGFPDDTDSPGPTLISRATLAEVGGWFNGLSLEATRLRFRANLEIEGVEAFWEDRLVASGIGTVRFRIGEAELLGTNPCARCIVPSRDARSGEPIQGFAREFARRRQSELPAFAAADRFDHFYRLSVNTRRVGGQPCKLRVGDEVQILDGA